MSLKQAFQLLDGEPSSEYPSVKFRAVVALGGDKTVSASKDCSLQEAERVLSEWKRWYEHHGLVMEDASDLSWVGHDPKTPDVHISGQILPRIT